MTDTLREKLRREVRRHRFMVTGCSDQPMCCSCQEGCCDEQGWMLTMTPDDHLDHIADAILAIPGIAVVELPSFDSIEDDFGVVDNKVRHYLPSGFGAYREYRLDDARDLAAALLAAADYVERDQ